jgi:hypothetical protein
VPALVVAVAVLGRRQLGLRDRIRQFNKYVYNRFTLQFAGQAGRPYTVIQHVGRHSGRAYSTPVVSDPIEGGFVVPLPYGTDVDWLKNVLAAKTFTLLRGGVEYSVGEPEVVDRSVVLPQLTPGKRIAYRVLGMERVFRVKTISPQSAESQRNAF